MNKKVEIKFIKTAVNAGRGRKVIYIPMNFADKVEEGKKYLVVVKGPVEEEDLKALERILEEKEEKQ